MLDKIYRVLKKSSEQAKAKRIIRKYGLPRETFFKGDVRITGKFKCGEGCKFFGDLTIRGNVELGRYVSLNGPNSDIYSKIHYVKIGSFTSIARNVSIQEFNHNYERLSNYYINQNILGESFIDDISSSGAIEIGNDVWIGTHCVILSGVKIGDGAIVAANSVVTKDIPPYAIAAGSPAKVIKYRFEQQTIADLLKLRWWEWPTEKIIENKQIFLSPNFEIKLPGI